MIFMHAALEAVAKKIEALPEGGINKDEMRNLIIDALVDGVAVLGRLIYESAQFNGLVVEREGRVYPGPRHKVLEGHEDMSDLISLLQELADK